MTMIHRKGALALALSTFSTKRSCYAFNPSTVRSLSSAPIVGTRQLSTPRSHRPSSSLRRQNASSSSAAATTVSPVTNDDPLFNNNVDYDWLKQSRPVRIGARSIPLDKFNSPSNTNGTSPPNNEDATTNCNNTKIVHFQRHAQGIHNQIYLEYTQQTGQPINLSSTDPTSNPLLLPNVIDAKLTPKGVKQSQEQYANSADCLKGVELIVVSPLVRALETSTITFGDHLPNNNANNYDDSNGNTNGRGTKWLAHEGCREELGLLLCNQRQPLSQTTVAFPHVDFSLLQQYGEEDVMWSTHAEQTADSEGNPQRETLEEMSHRVYDFLVNFLREREEKEVAVVGHSAWLHAMCNAVLECGEGEGDGEVVLRTDMFGQAEIRTMELTFTDKYKQ